MSADEWAGIRVYMQDRARFQRDAAAVARSTTEMGRAADALGRSTTDTTHRSWLMNQAMFTVRRIVYGLTLGIGALTATVAALGFQFNMMRETAQVSFTVLLGSAQAATNEIQYLFDLAARTPFDFPGVQQGARQLLNYGFSLQQTNHYLKVFSDIVAGFGGDTTVIDRIVRAIGQMHTKGRVMGQELLQLQEAGVNATQYLREQLGLTQQQISNIGRLGLRADVGVAAIIRGIETDPKFKGAADALQRTTQGRLTTFRDYISRLFGDILIAPFDAFSGRLKTVNEDLTQLVQTLENEGPEAFVHQLDDMTNAGGRVIRTWQVLKTVGLGLFLFLKNDLYPAFRDVSNIVALILYPILILAGHGLQFVGHHGTLFRVILTAIIARMVLMRSIAMAEWFFSLGRAVYLAYRAYRSLTAIQILQRITGLRMIKVMGTENAMLKSQILWRRRNMTMQQIEIALQNKQMKLTRLNVFWITVYRRAALLAATASAVYAGAGGGLAGVLAVLRFAIMGVTQAVYGLASAIITFLLTNPVGWIILAVAALAILYWRWKAFHDLVNRTAQWIANHWKPIVMGALIALGGPLIWIAGILATIISNFRTILRLAQRAFGWISKRLSGIGGFIGSLTGGIPFLAEGGQIFKGGWTVVGEQGPELRYMPAGARVTPMTKDVTPVGFEGEFVATAPIVLQIDRRVLAEETARIRLQKKARA